MLPIVQPSIPNHHPRLLERQKSMSFEPEFQRPSFLTEDVEEYCEGGFHPVRVGSLFRGRYFMRGKLGWGGCGIVWWAKDSIQERHVAIKILTANASKKFETFKTFYYLSARDNVVPHHPGRNHIIKLLRSFWHKGPNGNHLCLVLELAGPKIEDYAKHRPSGCLKLSEIQKMAFDTAKALSYLHINGYVHGDLTPSNVFMGITDPMTWSESQMETAEAIRKAVLAEPLLRTTGDSALPNGPRIITSCVQLWKLDPECLTADIIVGDLDASFPTEDSSEKLFILPPLHYCAPELITQKIPVPSNMCTDIWSLGPTLFMMRAGTLLFPRTKTIDKMFMSIRVRLGSSQALSELWTAKDEDVNDDGKLVVYASIRKSLRQLLEDIGRDVEEPIGSESVTSLSAPSEVSSTIPVKLTAEEWSPVPTSPAEIEMFHDLLNKMLQINPAKRIKIEEVLEHPWFTTEFETENHEE